MAVALACLLTTVFATAASQPGPPERLRLEYLRNPIGMDQPKPRFSWIPSHADRGEMQTAYRIGVHTASAANRKTPGELVWDSGIVKSSASVNVKYGGRPLQSATRYLWTVMYLDSAGKQSPASEWAFFHTGLFAASDWSKWTNTSWIGDAHGNQLRREFKSTASAAVTAAHVYVVGLGYYSLHINGQRASNHFLGSFTTFESRLLYDVHDVTDSIRQGQNAIAVSLGRGWYNQPTVNVGHRCLRFLLLIDYEDGSTLAVGSDENWKQIQGPIVLDDIYDGEIHDSRMKTLGWDLPNFNDSSWSTAPVVDAPTGVLSAAMIPPIKSVQTYTARNITQPSPGVFVYDFGQTMGGHTSIHIDNSGSSGTNVTLQHSEMIYENGSAHHLYKNTKELAVYIFDGSGDTVDFEPRFTYYGFRYVQVTGFPGTPDERSVVAHFTHTEVEEESAIVFSQDYNVLNRVQHCTRFSSLSNLQSLPTGCTQRERRGWTGDAQLSAEFTIHNFDMAALYTKWLMDLKDTQELLSMKNKGNGSIPDCVPWYNHGHLPGDPAWSIAYPLIVYYMHKYYEDTRVVQVHYSGLQEHVAHSMAMADQSKNILSFSLYGDWCAAVNKANVACNLYKSSLVSTFYLIVDLDVMASLAKLLGRQSDVEAYTAAAKKYRDGFVKTFYNPMEKTFIDSSVSNQTTNVLALHLNVAPVEDISSVFASAMKAVHDADDHLDTGIIGTKFLLPILTEHGQFDLALKIASQKTRPGWGWWVSQDATTLWESWFASKYEPAPDGEQSRNHIMFGSQGPWYYQAVAGINMADNSTGWNKLRIQSKITKDTAMSDVSATVGTYRGLIKSTWIRNPAPSAVFSHQISIPLGSRAEIHIPTFGKLPEEAVVSESDQVVWQSGKYQPGQAGITGASANEYEIVFEIGSGTYKFTLHD